MGTKGLLSSLSFPLSLSFSRGQSIFLSSQKGRTPFFATAISGRGGRRRRSRGMVSASALPFSSTPRQRLAAAVPTNSEGGGGGLLVLSQDDDALGGPLEVDAVVPTGTPPRMRLDAWLASQLPCHISRARVQASIRSGFAHVNGKTINKASCIIRVGDHVKCMIAALAPLKAEPEDIALDIVYEDNDVIVVNKPAHMVTHPAPGNLGGTLVNAILFHCELPIQSSSETINRVSGNYENSAEVDMDEDLDLEEESFGLGKYPSIRPGIVHRLDKGTSGLLVVAKTDYAHNSLAEQFKQHTVTRSYISLTCGIPSPQVGRVDVAIGRDIHNRVRMAAIPNLSISKRARAAASRYKVLEDLVYGACSVVEWRLETGRTHQIRVHAQHIGHPLLGDDVYGGTRGAILGRLFARIPSSAHGHAKQLVAKLHRPCLHALNLGFVHPRTCKEMYFSCPLPDDFSEVLRHLRQLGSL